MKVHKTIRLNIGFLSLLLGILFIANACYYDIEEELYPICDTTNITYSGTIVPIIDGSCNVCHSQGLQLGNISTEGYNNLKTIVDDGSFWGAINHNTNYSPMPKNGNKLSDCTLKQIKTWIDQGAPNN
ncbi:hypothetical protein ACFL6I_18945 [candidate division KSB1 bacterium]